MARKKDVDGQELLIENDTPAIKAAKKQIKEYDKMKELHREAHSADREEEKKKRAKVLSAVQESGIAPDAEGAYHITIDDFEWIIGQNSELKIKKHKVKDESVDEDELDPEDM